MKEEHRYVAGRNPVRELIESQPERIDRVFLQKNPSGSLLALRGAAGDAGVQVQFVPAGKLESLVPGVNHQGAVASVSPVAYVDVDDMLRSIAPTLEDVQARKPVILILDHIQDTHNLGAIARSAVASGVAGIVIPKRGAAPVTPAAVKTSAGTITRIPIARVSSLPSLLNQLKERGYWIAGAESEGTTSIWAMDWDRPLGLVIGGEEKGLGHAVRQACDYLITIPMPGNAESLNASVAAGILLFQTTRHRVMKQE